MSAIDMAELVESIVNKNNEKSKAFIEQIAELQKEKTSWEEGSERQERKLQELLSNESFNQKQRQELEEKLAAAEVEKKNAEKLVENAANANEEKLKVQSVKLTKLQKQLEGNKSENYKLTTEIEKLTKKLNESETNREKLDEKNSKRSELLEILMKENRENLDRLEDKLLEMQREKEILERRLDGQTQLFEVSTKSHDESQKLFEEKIENLEKEIDRVKSENKKSKQSTDLSSENQKLKDEVANHAKLMEHLINSNNDKCKKLVDELEKLRKEKDDLDFYDDSNELTTVSVIPEESFKIPAPRLVDQTKPTPPAAEDSNEATVLDHTVNEHEESIAVESFTKDIHRQIKNFHLRIDTNDWSNKSIVLVKIPYLVNHGKVGRRMAMVCPECHKKIVISRRMQIAPNNTQHEVNDIRSYKRHVKTFHKFDSLDKTYFK